MNLWKNVIIYLLAYQCFMSVSCSGTDGNHVEGGARSDSKLRWHIFSPWPSSRLFSVSLCVLLGFCLPQMGTVMHSVIQNKKPRWLIINNLFSGVDFYMARVHHVHSVTGLPSKTHSKATTDQYVLMGTEPIALASLLVCHSEAHCSITLTVRDTGWCSWLRYLK